MSSDFCNRASWYNCVGTSVPLADARLLHAFLESQQQFSNWIQDRIEQYEFAQDIDFSVIDNFIYDVTVFGGKRKIIEYHIKLDMANKPVVTTTPCPAY